LADDKQQQYRPQESPPNEHINDGAGDAVDTLRGFLMMFYALLTDLPKLLKAALEAVREGQARASLLSIRRLITTWIMAWLVSHNRS
jgi:hypothetical protein